MGRPKLCFESLQGFDAFRLKSVWSTSSMIPRIQRVLLLQNLYLQIAEPNRRPSNCARDPLTGKFLERHNSCSSFNLSPFRSAAVNF